MKNNFIKFTVVLVITSIVAAGILAYVNSKTEPVILDADRVKTETLRSEVLQNVDKFLTEDTVNIEPYEFIPGVDSNGKIIGYVVNVTVKGYVTDIEYIVGIDLEGKVTGLRILKQIESPGLGSNIGNIDWQDKWIGKDINYKFDKNVDAFAGATITPQAVYDGLIKMLETYRDKVINNE